MKTKVLQYAKNGNDIVEKYRELKPVPYHENIFYTPSDIEANFDRFDIIFRFKDTFIHIDGTTESNILELSERITSFYSTFLETRINEKWIQSIWIELFKRLELDFQSLINRREEIQKEREQNEEKKRLEKIEQQKIATEKRNSLLDEQLKIFKSGEMIDKTYFLELCDKYQVNLHIRTKGLLNRINNAEIGLSTARIYCKDSKKVNLDKVFEAANLLNQCTKQTTI